MILIVSSIGTSQVKELTDDIRDAVRRGEVSVFRYRSDVFEELEVFSVQTWTEVHIDEQETRA